jgi:hypothetical protein
MISASGRLMGRATALCRRFRGGVSSRPGMFAMRLVKNLDRLRGPRMHPSLNRMAWVARFPARRPPFLCRRSASTSFRLRTPPGRLSPRASRQVRFRRGLISRPGMLAMRLVKNRERLRGPRMRPSSNLMALVNEIPSQASASTCPRPAPINPRLRPLSRMWAGFRRELTLIPAHNNRRAGGRSMTQRVVVDRAAEG